MRSKVAIGFFLAATACGALAHDVDDAGPTDAAPPTDAGPPLGFEDVAIPDASAFDANVTCADGGDYVAVVDEAGTRVFDAGCDGGEPSAFYASCGHKIECVVVTACGGGGSIRMETFGPLPGGQPTQIAIDYAIDDAGDASYPGVLYVDDWPPVGGTVPGAFTTSGALHGTFCVERR